jgi:anthranilate phosphoribosyltransferase
VIETLIPLLNQRQALADEQVQQAMDWLVDSAIDAELKAGFLTALAQKGETPAEIAAFARALRDRSVLPVLDPATRAREILDIVGTGGDRLGTINISTTAALICAAAGVTVAKHGNRAVTSQAGSADVLEALGIPINLPPAEAALALRDKQFAFFFAPLYHPVYQHIIPARKLCAIRDQRTVFNLLGPLLNPARPSAMLMGVPRPELCEPLAAVLQSLGVRRAMVVCGQVPGGGHLDELSTLGENTIAEFYQERGFTVSTTLPEQFPLQPAALADLVGGNKMENALIARRILSGEERGPKRDAVLMNAAAALFVAGKTKSQAEGWDLAGETIDSGRAAAKLAELSR